MSSQTFTHTATTTAPIDDVWAALNRPETWEGIGGVDRILKPELDGEGRLQGFSFETVAAGIRYKGVAAARERVERETMSWDISNSEVKGVTSVTLQPTDAGTEVTVTLRVEALGFLSSMFFPAISAALGTGLPAAVDEFAAGLGPEG